MAHSLASDIQLLVDKDTIKELVYRWDYLGDDGKPVEAIERFCTDDVTFDAGPLGATDGKDAFKQAAETMFDEQLLFTRHMRHNPVIEVAGDEATGTWYADIPSITGDGDAIWLHGTYELDFRRVDDAWKISNYAFDCTYATPYEQGWAEQPFAEGIPGELNW